MNATELYTKSGKSTGVFYCAECRVTHRTKQAADECCKKRKRKCKCGAELDKYRTICDTCQLKKMAAAERARFEKAEKITPAQAEGMVFSDYYTDNDGFARDVGDLQDYFENEGQEVPSYAWACKFRPIVTVTSSDIIERCYDDSYEDWEHDGEGIEKLDKALALFVAANDKPCNKVWEPDYTRAIMLKEVS